MVGSTYSVHEWQIMHVWGAININLLECLSLCNVKQPGVVALIIILLSEEGFGTLASDAMVDSDLLGAQVRTQVSGYLLRALSGELILEYLDNSQMFYNIASCIGQ